MTIQLMPGDIPRYWELIKFACKKADEVDDRFLSAYFVELLHKLLNSSAQCFVRFTEDREVALLYITRLLYNAQLDENYLYIQVAFSWKRLPEETWSSDLEVLKRFASLNKCKYIGCMSRNPRIWEIVNKVGFLETTRVFAHRLT